MSRKHHGGPGPVPPGNRPQAGPEFVPAREEEDQSSAANGNGGAGFNNQDPERRLGGFESAGEHSRQQPGRINDGDLHSK